MIQCDYNGLQSIERASNSNLHYAGADGVFISSINPLDEADTIARDIYRFRGDGGLDTISAFRSPQQWKTGRSLKLVAEIGRLCWSTQSEVLASSHARLRHRTRSFYSRGHWPISSIPYFDQRMYILRADDDGSYLAAVPGMMTTRIDLGEPDWEQDPNDPRDHLMGGKSAEESHREWNTQPVMISSRSVRGRLRPDGRGHPIEPMLYSFDLDSAQLTLEELPFSSSDGVTDFEFSPDGRTLAIACMHERRLSAKEWFKHAQLIVTNSWNGEGHAPSNVSILSPCLYSTRLYLLDVATLMVRQEYEIPCRLLSFAPDGLTIACFGPKQDSPFETPDSTLTILDLEE